MGANFHRNYLLARSNLRKAKGQTTAMIVLVLLSSMMMNLWLMLATDYKKNLDRTLDRLNDGHVTLYAYNSSEEFRSFVGGYLENRSDVTEYCMTDVLGWVGTFKYGGGKINSNFIFFEKETALARNVGRIEIVEDSGYSSGIYLPMLYGTSYSAGDEIEIAMGSETLKYTICGFMNSVSAGSHNCGMCAMLLTEDKYNELSGLGSIPRAMFISARITDKIDSETVEAELRDAVAGEFPGIEAVSSSYMLVSTSRYISQSLCAAVLSAMAFLITLIAVVVISSNVMNYIHEDMQNLGAMKAIGYKSGQLIGALILQFSGTALITAIVGIALSYTIFPALNEMMISQTGIPYSVNFLIVPCAVTIAFTVGAVAAAVYFSAKRIRKIEPITALRQGIQTHSFKKNHVPLDKANAPLNFSLALKTVMSNKKQNVTICVTMLVLSLVIVFSGVMLENFILDEQTLIDLVAGETADSCINVNIGSEELLKDALGSDSRVKNAYQYTSDSVTHESGVQLLATMCDDFSQLGNQRFIVEGRFPKYDNEVAIAIKYAREKGLKIGQEIPLSFGAKAEKYIISGYTQISNNLGKDCLMTRSGFERISELTMVSYYINLTDGTDIDEFNKEITEPFSSEINASINIKATVEGTGRVYVSLMTVIVIAVLILSAVITVFVLYLLVRTILGNKKRDYGILKALGFTTGQLILQTALSFMPPIMISTAVGIAVSTFVINPLLALFFSGIGIVKCTFPVPLYFDIAAGVGLVLFAFGAACLMSLRVRKITPRELLNGE